MTKWLTSLFLIAVLGGSALAGMPLHSNEEACSMSGMTAGMDCCAMAHQPDATPQVSAARLCCAVNCPQQGTTTPTSSAQPTSSLSINAVHPAAIQQPFAVQSVSPGLSSAQDYLSHSPPTYIQHLALLI
jgi:hypothetical protein